LLLVSSLCSEEEEDAFTRTIVVILSAPPLSPLSPLIRSRFRLRILLPFNEEDKDKEEEEEHESRCRCCLQK
jgi:hypothetical protein